MLQLLTLIPKLLAGRKTYLTGGMLVALGLGVLGGYVEPETATSIAAQGPPTFADIEQRLEAASKGDAGAPQDGLVGIVSLLLGLNSMAQRAGVAKLAQRGD